MADKAEWSSFHQNAKNELNSRMEGRRNEERLNDVKSQFWRRDIVAWLALLVAVISLIISILK